MNNKDTFRNLISRIPLRNSPVQLLVIYKWCNINEEQLKGDFKEID